MGLGSPVRLGAPIDVRLEPCGSLDAGSWRPLSPACHSCKVHKRKKNGAAIAHAPDPESY